MTEKNERYIVKGSDDFFLHIEDTTFHEDRHEGSIYNIYQVVRRLNEQDERIEALKEDVEIILDYVLNKGKFAMTVKEQKAHNRLRGFVRGDME